MIRFAVCDDNDLQLEITADLLRETLGDLGAQAEIARFPDGRALLADVRERGGYDAYILDMIMPGMNGLELASTLRMLRDDGEIVFLTSSLEYAVQSYDVRAFYYLLKPVDGAKFARVIGDLLTRLGQRESESICVHTARGALVLRTRDILCVSVENRIPRYRLRDGRSVTGTTLRRKFREEMAPLLEKPAFAECGVSCVVNLSCVDAMDSESLILTDGTVLYPPQHAITAIRGRWMAVRGK